jgi:hypothetical protein
MGGVPISLFGARVRPASRLRSIAPISLFGNAGAARVSVYQN